jgi:hypothetical protein
MLNKSETDEDANGGNDAGQAAPGSTMTPKQVRFLKIAVAVMSALLVIGFIALIAGIYYQSTKKPKPADTSAAALMQERLGAPVPLLNVPLHPSSQVVNVLADQGRLIVHVREAAGDEIIIIDLTTGWTQQRITFRPQP